jgi:hypothetical protein
VLGTALMIITMLAHPHADSLADLLSVPPIVFAMNIFTHSMGLLSVPFVLLGAWQLTRRLATPAAAYAFIAMCGGMVAIVSAMTLDGLVVSALVAEAKRPGAVDGQLATLLVYNTAVIQSFSLVYVVAVTAAVLTWSVGILRSIVLPKWIGYYGVIMVLAAALTMLNGIALVDFIGIKLFVFGFVSWTLLMGILLRKPVPPQLNAVPS